MTKPVIADGAATVIIPPTAPKTTGHPLRHSFCCVIGFTILASARSYSGRWSVLPKMKRERALASKKPSLRAQWMVITFVFEPAFA